MPSNLAPRDSIAVRDTLFPALAFNWTLCIPMASNACVRRSSLARVFTPERRAEGINQVRPSSQRRCLKWMSYRLVLPSTAPESRSTIANGAPVPREGSASAESNHVRTARSSLRSAKLIYFQTEGWRTDASMPSKCRGSSGSRTVESLLNVVCVIGTEDLLLHSRCPWSAVRVTF